MYICFYMFYSMSLRLIHFKYSKEFSLNHLTYCFDPESYSHTPMSGIQGTFRHTIHSKWLSGCKSDRLTYIYGLYDESSQHC